MTAADKKIVWAHAERQAAFERWIAGVAPRHELDLSSLAPASADASFRRYLRVGAATAAGGSLIVMDAPPPLEDVRPFVHVAALAAAAGLHVPRVLEADAEHGFLLLTDLGEALYLDALRAAAPDQADRLMSEALSALVRWQQGVPAAALPPYDEVLLARELALFPLWCVEREFGITWSAEEQGTWQRLCGLLSASALAQPVVAVHADWMPRNLMSAPAGAASPGILDFQDAVAGPVTYDLASLLRDAFLSWEEEQELDWAVRWWQQARRAGLPVDADFGEFWRALDWMGLQRHLKVLGIFCRLKHRDGKPRYAQDLPRFFAYAQRVALRYTPLKPLVRLLEPLSGASVRAGYTF
jgi:aminoglycoside/choline kinase family phosphotransferase